jgi:hypothetical protein
VPEGTRSKSPRSELCIPTIVKFREILEALTYWLGFDSSAPNEARLSREEIVHAAAFARFELEGGAHGSLAR